MRLIVCSLCTGDDPFACPVKFRRTYMQLHLEKSHSLVAKEHRILRIESKAQEFTAEWMTVTGESQKRILVELEFDLPYRQESSHQSGQTAIADSSDPDDESAKWSATAMQSLYRNREGLNTAL